MGEIKEAGRCTVCKLWACLKPGICYEHIMIRNTPINLFVNLKKLGYKPRKGKEHYGI